MGPSPLAAGAGLVIAETAKATTEALGHPKDWNGSSELPGLFSGH
jgi:hypothetical protein